MTMTDFGSYNDLGVSLDAYVATVEIQRPPHNFFDFSLIAQIADAFEALDKEPACRAVVLAAQGKSFCAGANFGSDGSDTGAVAKENTSHLYQEAVRLFRTRKPIIGAIQGAAIGGGLGLAMVADLRVSCPEARFSANFTRLGFHPGFGLTVTLPALIGPSKAALMFYTSRRVKGDEAYAMGLADVLVAQNEVRNAAAKLAAEIAECAPLGVTATRATLRRGLADKIKTATDHELAEQMRLRETDDFKEGTQAMAQRRLPNFSGG